MKIRLFAVLAAAGACLAAPLAAQTSNPILGAPGAGSPVMDKIGAADISSMMAELGIAVQRMETQETPVPILVAQVSSGARFLFRLNGCADNTAATGCNSAIVSTAMPSGGVTYDDINEFNGTASVSTAVNVPGQQMLVFGRNIIVLGGHSRELFKGTVYLFLRDVQNFAETKAGATSVAFAPTPERSSKISGLGARIVMDPTGAFGISDFGPEVDAAIANTPDVSFAVDYDGGL